MEVVLTLQSGEKLIVNIQPFAEFLEEAEIKTPEELSSRFQVLMDRFVETVQTDPSSFDVNLFKNDYEFLRKCRELFKQLTWKGVDHE